MKPRTVLVLVGVGIVAYWLYRTWGKAAAPASSTGAGVTQVVGGGPGDVQGDQGTVGMIFK